MEFTLDFFLHYKILTCNCNFVLCFPVCVGIYSTYGGEKRYIQGFRGKPEGRRPFRRPRRWWENNIKMYLLEVGWATCPVWIRLRTETGGGLS